MKKNSRKRIFERAGKSMFSEDHHHGFMDNAQHNSHIFCMDVRCLSQHLLNAFFLQFY